MNLCVGHVCFPILSISSCFKNAAFSVVCRVLFLIHCTYLCFQIFNFDPISINEISSESPVFFFEVIFVHICVTRMFRDGTFLFCCKY